VLTASSLTNEMLKNIIKRIEVDHSGGIEALLKKSF
jgi:phage-related protein